ncbi:hypothetical protein DV735_g5570, partial [Chaetothyriales sp. CBS 134920]
MTFSEQQIRIISDHPLKDTLRNCDNLNITSLLGALVLSPAACYLPSPHGKGKVAAELLSILQHVREGASLDPFGDLASRVAANSSDIDIWSAVYDLITALGPSTPPRPSLPATFNATPIKISSSWLADTAKRTDVEERVFREIEYCTFRNVEGFSDKYFKTGTWRKDQKQMHEMLMKEHNGKKWTGFPTSPDEQSVWNWLCLLEERALAGAPYKLHTTKTAYQFKEGKGQMDIFFQALSDTPEFKHVRVAGEQKKSYDKSRFKAVLLQLTRYVRSIFYDQPTRRFMHAFTLCASTMELWVFDRSGAYSSGPFDIHDKPDMFARALVGYATMDDESMGLDLFIERVNNAGKLERYVTLDVNSKQVRIGLEEAIARQNAIVCRGTACYTTKTGQVVKLSWASDQRTPEEKLLKLAEKKGVKGVVRVVTHCELTMIAKLRKGLEFRERHKFQNDEARIEDLPSTVNTSPHKRKLLSDPMSEAPKPKRWCVKGQKQAHKQSVNKAKPDKWENRVFYCIVTSLAGRVISDFKSIKELLEAMQDAIRAHQSLHKTGNILHHDISCNNIIMTKPETANGFKGMLIDLDLAKVRDSEASGAQHQTGTMQFMVVEVLCSADHTYRHDLESFFYVLLWMCARQSWHNGLAGETVQQKLSGLQRWEIGSFEDIAHVKIRHIMVDGLESIMGEFPLMLEVVKPLCLAIWSILFGDSAKLVLGTPAGEPDELYRPVIEAYDDICSLPERAHRRVVVDDSINLVFGIGGRACDLVQFQIVWHRHDKHGTDLYFDYRPENPSQTRTILHEQPTTAHSRSITRIHTPGPALTIRYSRRGKLGTGAFGEVLKVADVDTGNYLAVKQVKRPTLLSHEYVLLKREVETLSRMSHRNIIEYISAQWAESGAYLDIVMEIKLGSVADLMQVDFFIRERTAARPFLHQMLQALDYLASQSIVHRDVKPENILYSDAEDGGYLYQLADLGLCNLAADAHTIAGSSTYMAPELERNPQLPQTPKMDEAVNERDLQPLQDMAMEDPSRRASAGDMLDKLFSGEGRTNPRNQTCATAIAAENAEAGAREQRIEQGGATGKRRVRFLVRSQQRQCGRMSPGIEQVKDEGTKQQVVISGSVAGLVSRFVIAPLDVVKIRLQLQPHSLSDPLSCDGIKGPTYKGVFTSMRTIIRQEGVRSLWKGNIPAELMYLCYGGIQFASYRSLTQAQEQARKHIDVHLPFRIPGSADSFFAGAGAGAIATTATYPMDLLRTRFAAQGTDKIYNGLVAACRDIVRDEGLRGFFRGMSAAVGSIVPYMGLFFSSYEIFHQAIGGATMPFGSGDAVAGVLASIVAKSATFPLDLIRKRLQIQGPTRHRYIHTNVPEYKGVFGGLLAIWRKEGVRGWYRGLTVSLVKAAPASAVTMYVYERTLHALMSADRTDEMWEIYTGYEEDD